MSQPRRAGNGTVAGTFSLGILMLGLALLGGCGDNLRSGSGPDGTGLLELSPTGGLSTTESGGTATFEVMLNAQPAAEVTVALSSTNPLEGELPTATLTFTPTSWNVPQQVLVRGVDDDVADGDQVYAIQLDAGPNGSADVALANRDDDVVGVTVTPTQNLETSESGNTATFTVSLSSKPTADVMIPLSSTAIDEGIVAPPLLQFTRDNWNAMQVVTVTGIDDLLSDGNQAYTIALGPVTSGDDKYNAFDPDDVTVTNLDNDNANIFVSPTTGLVTSEEGDTASFSVVLLSQPSADVTIPVASSTPTEGTTSVASVTFTSVNWSSPRTITVTGVDDAVADGPRAYQIVLAGAITTDAQYLGLDPTDVSVTNLDDDTAGISISAPQTLTTSESGDADFITLVLQSQPTAPVTIALSSADPTEGAVAPTPVTFDPTNWNQAQTVTITGLDDALTDGNQVYVISLAPAVSADANYAGIDPADVTAINLDNELSGITVAPTANLFTSEFGDTDTFDIVLNAQPTADVTITLASTDPGEGIVSPASVTFSVLDWNVPQTVTVTGVNDAVADGDQTYTIVTNPATSADTTYALLDAANVTVTNTDDESPGVFVKARPRLQVGENGQDATFRVRLTAQPAADVVCALSSNDLTEGQVEPMTLTFTAQNFNQFQTVRINPVDDDLDDNDQLFGIILAPCTSADGSYDGIDPRDVAVLSRDDE